MYRQYTEADFGPKIHVFHHSFFGPTDQDLMGKCRGNILMLPLMCLDMHLVLFWPIGGSFSKGKYEKYAFYEIQEYGLKI